MNTETIALTCMWAQPTPPQLGAIVKHTSPKRLRQYRRVFSGREAQALELYVLDAKITSTLHGHLRLAEIVLREQVNRALTTAHGPQWYRLIPGNAKPATPAGLGNTSREMVAKATISLQNEAGWHGPGHRRNTRQQPPNLLPDKVVAELMLGFWTSLLQTPGDADHSATIWAVGGVEAAFNRRSAGGQAPWSQHDAMRVCQRLTWARNRVNHCESVVFGFPQKGIRHQKRQLRLPPRMILEDCRRLVGRFDSDIESWMRTSAVVDHYLADPGAAAAWTEVEQRPTVITPTTAPTKLWKIP